MFSYLLADGTTRRELRTDAEVFAADALSSFEALPVTDDHPPAMLTAATAAIPGPVTHEWIDGGRHDLRGADRRIADMVATWLSTLP